MSIERKGSDDVKHPPATSSAMPYQDSTEGQAAPSRQERALRYLERKRLRQEAMLSEVPDGINTESESESEAEQITDKMPIISRARPAVKENVMPDLPLISSALQTPSSQLVMSSPLSTEMPAGERLQYWRRHRKLVQRRLVRKRIRGDRVRTRHTYARILLTLSCVGLSLLLVLLSVSSATAYVGYRFYSDTQAKYLTRIVSLHDLLPRDNLKMYDRKGVFIGQLTDRGMHTTIKLKQVSPDLINATIATEDKNFWTNQGLDAPRILQAAIDNLRSGRVVEGGSTITQQLIKNLVLGNEATLTRKLTEVVLTPQVNDDYSKNDILEMYLNSIYYGQQAYGIDAAANVFFGLQDTPSKPASQQLDLAQSAMLAGLPNYPDGNNPLHHPQAAFSRLQIVLDAMVAQHYITKVQALDALAEAHSPHFFKKADVTRNRAPHFFNFVLEQLQQMYRIKRSDLSRSDMNVYTTLDIGLQDKIQKIAQQRVAELRDYHNLTNAAEVLIDYHTGAIISLLGSIDYNNKSIDGQYDVATQGYRQPGSSFKPYVYVTAFEQGASPAQAIDDAPLTINLPGENPPTFSPQNYDLHYHGHMTLRCALQNSLNVPAVKVLQHVGITDAMRTAQDMGITRYEGTPGYSLVLGGLGVRLLDHTSAFGTFANNGVHMPYYAINKVSFVNAHQTYMHPRDQGHQVISPQMAYMMTNVLSDNTSRLPEFDDCNPLQLYSNPASSCWAGDRGRVRPAAAKTGTTTDFRDNWTLGYTTDYVMGVWAGNDNNTPMYDISGIQGAAPIWHDAMLLAEQGRPVRNFNNPGGLERATVTYPDGVKTSDWFMPGAVPSFDLSQQSQTQGSDNGNGINPILPISTPTTGKKKPDTPVAHPYCPSNFNFDFPPPSSKEASGWW
jgi:membrane peptidoglycan carboxypeptidase